MIIRIDSEKLQALGFNPDRLKPLAPKGRPVKLSPQQHAIVLELISANFSAQSVADSLSVSRQTIINSLERSKQ